MQPSDPLLGVCRGDAVSASDWAAAHGAQGPVQAYAYALWNYCAAVGVDAAVLFPQAADEAGDTGADGEWHPFVSRLWVTQNNPAGIGIDGDGVTTWVHDSPFTAGGGDAAALVHVATVWTYLGHPTLPTALVNAEKIAAAWLARVRTVIRDPPRPKIVTVDDLSINYRSQQTGNWESTWAWNADQGTGPKLGVSGYARDICAIGNRIWPALPDAAKVLPPLAPLVLFVRPKLFHARAGALMRTGPGRDYPVGHTCADGERVWCRGWRRGQDIEGSDRWAITGGPNGYAVHQSGLVEPVG